MASAAGAIPLNIKRGLARSVVPAGGRGALLLGQTMIGWRVWDVMRTIDYIATRKELDAKRVGCMGISGGGTCTLFSAALEPRIKAAMVSGYLNTFRDSIGSISPLHRQLRSRHSELGRDVRRRRPDRAAAAVRRIGTQGQHLPDRREHRELQQSAARSTRSSGRTIASITMFSMKPIAFGARRACHSWLVICPRKRSEFELDHELQLAGRQTFKNASVR